MTANSALGKRFSVKSFPTLKLFKAKEKETYTYKAGPEWPRDAEHLIKFATLRTDGPLTSCLYFLKKKS